MRSPNEIMDAYREVLEALYGPYQAGMTIRYHNGWYTVTNDRAVWGPYRTYRAAEIEHMTQTLWARLENDAPDEW